MPGAMDGGCSMERDAGCRAVDLRCRVKREHLGSLGHAVLPVALGLWQRASGWGCPLEEWDGSVSLES